MENIIYRVKNNGERLDDINYHGSLKGAEYPEDKYVLTISDDNVAPNLLNKGDIILFSDFDIPDCNKFYYIEGPYFFTNKYLVSSYDVKKNT